MPSGQFVSATRPPKPATPPWPAFCLLPASSARVHGGRALGRAPREEKEGRAGGMGLSGSLRGGMRAAARLSTAALGKPQPQLGLASSGGRKWAAAAALGMVTGFVATSTGLAAGQAECAGEEEPPHVSFWTSRWKTSYQQHKPGFHQDEVSPALIKFKDELVTPGEKHDIFVPLCGKTLDLVFLAGFGDVAGVEVAQDAIDGFAKEQSLAYDDEILEKSGGTLFQVDQSKGLEHKLAIAKIDFFNLPDGWSDLSSGKHRFSLCWDRASLVAITPDLREQYVQVILDQLKPDGKILLSTLSYDQSKHSGPPFSVPEDEVHRLYSADFDIKLLERGTSPIQGGSEALLFLLQRKA
ncbi:Thiopurine S-methyltransferase (Thiopurine methyltransferase) [Durusdinium trenchii]|uniref:Thiopurine S-methyltransferase (Thiopurine methyltransferase) n=1 Tax=Durusdinium trenchii TaxID=1381693 RepID=A0ABP0HRP4_9DINO